jgi:hypothetical protein
MVGIDTANGLVYLNVNLDIYWFDYRLAWNTTLAPVYQVYIDSSYLWVPDITLYNQADGSTIVDVPVLLSHDGSVWSSRQGYLVYNCDLNMLKFPFDVQVCPRRAGDLERSVLDNPSPFMQQLYTIEDLLWVP